MMDDGRWTMDDGRWTMDDGRWTITKIINPNLQPDLNENPFFCIGNCVGKKDWEWKAEMSAIKKFKVTFDGVKCLPK